MAADIRAFAPLLLLVWHASASAAQPDPICTKLTQPGLYLLRPSQSEPARITGPVVYEEGSSIYVVPWFGPKLVEVDKELVWHIRMQTTARSAPRSNEVYVYRSKVQTECSGSGNYVGPGMGAWFEAFEPNERYVSLRRYNDHHPSNDAQRRYDGGLGAYFHFEVSSPNERNCFRTDNSKAVGNLDSAYGFRDVPVQPLTSPPSLISEAQANESEPTTFSPKYAGLASIFVHLSGPTNACFSLAAPVPTSSNFFHQLTTYGRDAYAQAQGRLWKPDQTDLDFHVLPRGGHYYAKINWIDAARR